MEKISDLRKQRAMFIVAIVLLSLISVKGELDKNKLQAKINASQELSEVKSHIIEQFIARVKAIR